MKKFAYTHDGDGNGHPPGLVLTWDTVRGAGALLAIVGTVIMFGADWSPKTTDRKIQALSERMEALRATMDDKFMANASTRNLIVDANNQRVNAIEESVRQINQRFDSIEKKLDTLLMERRGR